MRKFWAFLLTLAFLVQMLAMPVAVAERVATATDLDWPCKECGEKVVLGWVDNGDGTHVEKCPHGVALEASKTKHDYTYEFDNDTHWGTCKVCGAKTEKEAHKNSYGSFYSCSVCLARLEVRSKNTKCDECGGYMIWSYYFWDGSDHVVRCDHGVFDETTRHEPVYTTAECTYDDVHMITCDVCNMSNEEGHWAYCTNPTVCAMCKGTNVEMTRGLVHNYPDRWETDGVSKWRTCKDCNYKHVHDSNTETYNAYDKKAHWTVCVECEEIVDAPAPHINDCTAKDPVCLECGAVNVEIGAVGHRTSDTYEYDAEQHWDACMDCGEKFYGDHVQSCTQPGVCIFCGQSDVNFNANMQHSWTWKEYEYDANQHWATCTECKEVFNQGIHIDTCRLLGTCVECGQTGVNIGKTNHLYCEEEYQFDDKEHWRNCTDCDGRGYVGEHVPSADDPLKCEVCGAAIRVVEPTAEPTSEPTTEPTTEPTETPTATPIPLPTEKPTTKPTEKPTEKPTDEPTVKPTDEPTATPTVKPTDKPTATPTAKPTDEPIATPTVKPTDEPIATPTVKPTDEPTATPTVKPTDEPTATPTVKPTEAPTVEPTKKPAPAHEHTFDLAFVSNNDGTHSKACLGNCGEVVTEKCQLVTTDMGLMTCTACATCGYAVYEAKAGVAALEEGKQVPAKVVRIETAAIAPAPESAPEAVPADTALLVHETTFDLPVALSTELKGTVEKVFTAALVKDGQTFQPTGKVKLSIPMDEEALAQLEGKVLMLLREDGTLVEIAYEIVDGQLVFLTDSLGVFLLMNPEA